MPKRKAKDNKALWVPRGILVVAFAIIAYFGVFVNDIHTDAVIPIVLFALLILISFFALSFLLPIVSAVFYIIISAFFLFILSFGYSSGSSELEIFGIDALLVAMWLILIASLLLIIIYFSPQLDHFFKNYFIGSHFDEEENIT